ncbi:hypothetical protein KKA08_03325, partial [bacterium]|nr:hypothetical protein [bacterium]
IESEPGGPEYLWFNLKVAAKSDAPIWFMVENALNAHQTNERWSISRPFFSTDGKNWIRCIDSRFGKEGIAKQGGDPVFRFRSPIVADTLYTAYFQPFTLSDLETYLQAISTRENVSVSVLGQSEEGRDIPMVMLPSIGASEDTQTIWIVTREHPGEAPASFVCQGMIEALLSDEYKSLWQKFSFKIVPILNVDGVEACYYYHNAKGVNLARDWVDFEAVETRALKSALEQDTTGPGIPFVVNLHSSNDPSKGHFFLKIPSRNLSVEDAERQKAFYKYAGRQHDQIQGNAPVILKDIPGIMGNVLYEKYGIYVLYFESNYSRGADGSDVTVESLLEVGEALVNAVALVTLGEPQ